ncbi:hypothetical protein BDQ12DRAFT_715166 [Crucibulum laeve]|uniref:Uncharacterized protein n=1 Tax=Crucibulum laeve TaxID=68775 RepID=A0A5C3LP35_9AGAR|nr:hypothetical protein BDQ12DRAFT_715166 [Crucibulum laeve]
MSIRGTHGNKALIEGKTRVTSMRKDMKKQQVTEKILSIGPLSATPRLLIANCWGFYAGSSRRLQMREDSALAKHRKVEFNFSGVTVKVHAGQHKVVQNSFSHNVLIPQRTILAIYSMLRHWQNRQESLILILFFPNVNPPEEDTILEIDIQPDTSPVIYVLLEGSSASIRRYISQRILAFDSDYLMDARREMTGRLSGYV